MVANLNANYRKITVFGNYALSYGTDDNEGLPADPYNLRAEWGPSSYGDIRHRAVLDGVRAAAGEIRREPVLRGEQRPAVQHHHRPRPEPHGRRHRASGTGGRTVRRERGCFNLNPAPGTAIEHNYGRGPGAINLAMRVSRTWSFGPERAAAPADTGGGHGGAHGVEHAGRSGDTA